VTALGAVNAPDRLPTVDDLVQRARDLAPALRQRADTAEQHRRMPDETLADLTAAGVLRVVQPRRFGGYEMGALAFVRVMAELSRGDGSAGWVASLVGGHTKWLAYYPLEGQLEVYRDHGDARLPLVVAPQGRATPVDGGYLVSGAWRYVSGCDVTNWLAAHAVLGEEGGPPSGVVSVVIPRHDYDVVDDWYVLGLRASGSKQAVVDDLFVPERRAVRIGADREPIVPDPVHQSGFYRAPMAPFFALELAAVVTGVGRGALDHFEAWAQAKTSPFPPFARPADSPDVQLRFARATAIIDGAEATLHQAAADYDERAAEDLPYAGNDTRRALLRLQWLTEQVIVASDLLVHCAGSSAMRDGNPLQRCARDLAMARTHYLLDMSRTGVSWSRYQFGLEPTSLL
jgi:3-hydroxy-9,10-secoandrosta-1,3,5(10)-triene-9,17-dione monooxygenase